MSRISCAGAALLLIAGSAIPTGAENWQPVDPADLALASSDVESGADAEVLAWDVRVEDVLDEGGARTLLDHHILIKIFNDRGRESQGTVAISYGKNVIIDGIAGRTIKRDGTIVPLAREAIFDRTTLKSAGVKEKQKSFAMPAVEAGAILEYRYRETRNNSLAHYLRLQCQRDIPVRKVTYHIKPTGLLELPMRSQTFHGSTTPFERENDGFYKVSASGLPAYHTEPYMPPEDEVRMWLLIYYTEDKKLDPPAYWKDYGRDIYEAYRTTLRPSGEVKQAAAEAIGGATTDAEKLTRLFDYVRAKVKNSYDVSVGLTDADRARLKDNRTPSETLKRGMGSGYDINMLFGALAAAAGFDVRIAKLGDRGDTFFSPTFPDAYFLTTYDIAVRVGNDWRFFDPGTIQVASDMLRWEEEGQQALVTDPKDPVFVLTPISPPERSLERRVGAFKLDAEGGIEGDLRFEYFGHRAMAERREHEDDSPSEREDAVRDLIKSRIGTAEVSAVTIENATDMSKPLVAKCHVKASGYAQRVGKRLLIQPAFFEHGEQSPFTASTRAYPIYFHFPWAVQDSVRITLPDDFTLDVADAPAPINVEGISKYVANVGITTDGALIQYTRDFRFGDDGAVIYPVASYKGLKQLFEMVTERDGHTLTLKQMEQASK